MAFADYYRATVLAEETEPNKLHDLKATPDGYQVHSPAQVDELVARYLGGAVSRRRGISAARTAIGWTRFSTPVSPTTASASTRTARWTSRARPRRSCAPTDFCPRCCPTPTPSGKSARRNSDRQNARIEHDKALSRGMTAVLKDDTELFRQFTDNDGFRRWLTDMVFGLTYATSRREA